MQNISIILDAQAFPVQTVRLEPLERGRVAVFVRSPVTLRKGETCTIRTSTGVELECVVAELHVEATGIITELRCIPEPAL